MRGMQPHSAAIMFAFHNHYWHSPDKTSYSIKAWSSNRRSGGPSKLDYTIRITKNSDYSWSTEVSGDISYSTIKGCSGEIKCDDPKKAHFRLTHRSHSNISEERWSLSEKEIYDGRFTSGDSSRNSTFSANIQGERSATFKESGGLYETWDLSLY